MTVATMHTHVAVMGAGLVGLSAALAMHQLGFSVVLIDAHAQLEAEYDKADWDQRIYAISPRNANWLKSLGVWQHLDLTRLTQVETMQIWGDTTPTSLDLNSEAINADAMAFIVEERALKLALLQQVLQLGLPTIFGINAHSVNILPTQAQLTLENGKIIHSDLLLAADGANSWVRQQANIAVTQKDYRQTAIVANFSTEHQHSNSARQWFRQEKQSPEANAHCGILAWLPLPERRISIVWSVSTDYAQYLLQLDDVAFTQQVMQAGNAALGEMTLLGARAAFPLVLKKAEVLAQDALVLIGDAAHRIHPMAGQGVNLGFRDVIDLADILHRKHHYQSLSDQRLLKQYTRSRKADVLNMTSLTSGLYHLFESQNTMVQKVRNWGLTTTHHPALNKMLVKRAIAL
jgi:2-octaprenylphenol hydroxylase